MSADNFLAIRSWNDKWVIADGNASTGEQYNRGEVFTTRDEAIDRAMDILSEEVIEYGLLAVDRIGEGAEAPSQVKGTATSSATKKGSNQ